MGAFGGQIKADRVIADLATAQHGVVGAAQLRAAGVTARQIHVRVRSQRLHRIHQGVYAVGHPLLTKHGRWMAAVLAAGPDAVLSHRSAAALLELRRSSGRVEVTSPRRGRSQPGVHVYRVRDLAPDDVTVVDGIPVTSVARTLLDLGGLVSLDALERACDQAEILQLFDLTAVEAVLARHPKRRGARALRAVLSTHAIGTALTDGELERRFRAFCRRWHLPRPQCNVALALPHGEKTTVDFLWPAHRVVVETDGWRTHRTRQAFEHDRARDTRLSAAGYRPLRITWRRLDTDPERVAQEIRAVLARTDASSWP